MRISDWSSDVCSSDLFGELARLDVIDPVAFSFGVGEQVQEVPVGHAALHIERCLFCKFRCQRSKTFESGGGPGEGDGGAKGNIIGNRLSQVRLYLTAAERAQGLECADRKSTRLNSSH